MHTSRSATILPLLLAGLLFAACGATTGPSPSPTSPPTSPSPSPTSPAVPSPTPAPSAVPTGPVSDADTAVARVLASDPRFAGIRRLDPNLIGQGSWYTVERTGSDFKVTVRIGWGDCESGCIDEHVWVFQVVADGSIALQSETGKPVPPGIGGGPGPGASTLDIALVAGPVCPVERNPPDPGCAPRPVVGARVIVRDAAGVERASGVSDELGHVRLSLPAGAYSVEALAVQGMMGNPSISEVQIAATGTTEVTLEYDTGIR